MAKKRHRKAHKAAKRRMPAGLRKYWASHKRGGHKKHGHRKHARRRTSVASAVKRVLGGGKRKRRRSRSISLRSVSIRGLVARRNAGLLRIPTTQELTSVAIAALALPAVTKLVTNLPFMPSFLQANADGTPTWGSIATELALASVASVGARRFVGSAAGDVIFVLGLARGIQNSVRKLSPDLSAKFLGLGEVAYYSESQLGYMNPQSTQLGAGGDQMDTLV